jgi:tetratricopeptide (TPR) repeat protein
MVYNTGLDVLDCHVTKRCLMNRKVILLSALIIIFILTSVTFAAVGQQDAESPQAEKLGEIQNPTVAQQSSDNSVPLDEYKKFIEREIDHQDKLINMFIAILSIIIIILIALFGIQIFHSRRQADRELKHVEEIRKRANIIVEEEIPAKCNELIDDVTKQFDELINNANLRFDELYKTHAGLITEIHNKLTLFERIKEKKGDEKLSQSLIREIKLTTEKIIEIPEKNRRAIDYFILAIQEENLENRIKLYSKVIKLNPDNSYAYKNIACALSLKGEKEEALDNLETAANKGFRKIKLARSDKDLDSLRDDPRFEEILKKIEENAKGE